MAGRGDLTQKTGLSGAGLDGFMRGFVLFRHSGRSEAQTRNPFLYRWLDSRFRGNDGGGRWWEVPLVQAA
ncbi:hypothetical protein TH24_10175 [Thalassospira xiamenensis]|nr:hypothetical protein TH24_10175 [Thalassospira xiamenensis]